MTAARRPFAALAALGTVLVLAGFAGCAAIADSGASDTTTVGTVSGVGELPPSVSATESAVPDTLVDSSVETSVDAAGVEGDSRPTTTTIPPELTVGARAAGNRLLMIGDSLTASVASRYGGEACKALVPLGWRVEVDAETGRFIDFGKLVLDQRLDAGWDAAVIFLGNNYGDDPADFQRRLHAMLLRLVPSPTVLVTTSLFRPQQAEVNAAIREEAAQFTSVTVIDWETLSTDPSLTGADNLHLTDAGRRAYAFQLASTLGTAPEQPGECLKTRYTNDSAGSPNGPTGNNTGTKTTVKPKPTSSSLATSTTVRSGGTTPTTAVTSSSTGGSTATTTPPTLSSATPTTVTQTTAKPAPTTTAAPIVTIPPTTAAPEPTIGPPSTGA